MISDPPISLEQALRLPRGRYVENPQIDDARMITAEQDQLIITNRNSIYNIPYTDGYSTCLCITVDNITTGTTAMAHLSMHEYRKDALIQIIKQVQQNPHDKLKIHMIGGSYDSGNIEALNENYKKWQNEMQSLLDVINSTPNAQLVTFDVGHKTYPRGVAFKPYKAETQLISMLRDIDIDDINFTPPRTPRGFEPSAETPFYFAWDGRLPENQMRQIPAKGSKSLSK